MLASLDAAVGRTRRGSTRVIRGEWCSCFETPPPQPRNATSLVTAGPLCHPGLDPRSPQPAPTRSSSSAPGDPKVRAPNVFRLPARVQEHPVNVAHPLVLDHQIRRVTPVLQHDVNEARSTRSGIPLGVLGVAHSPPLRAFRIDKMSDCDLKREARVVDRLQSSVLDHQLFSRLRAAQSLRAKANPARLAASYFLHTPLAGKR